ncbi:ATP synthase membrane subunit K, mitochondrial [Brachionichthys hirsutus]|uniref:ATP synthase membrane subunit K, mitochondrial n=1 Tax=Brachionichthys hirsutus TaxID=412623 RepID=UPI0036046657
MGGNDSVNEAQFTGFARYFNSETITGRRNYVLATYAGILSIFLFFKLRPKKQAAVKQQ